MADPIDWAAIEAHPQDFANWVAGVQKQQASAAGVDPIYAQVAQKYGYLAAYLNHPELGPILKKAAQEGWSAELLQGAISNTQWWHDKSASERQFDLLANTDSKTALQQIHSKAMELQATAAKMGLHFDDWTTLTDMANVVLKDSTMGESEIAWMLGSQMHYNRFQHTGGQVGGTMASAKQRAADYMVNITDRQAFQQAKNVAMGIETPDDIELRLREQAKKQYAWLAPEIDSGHTMRDLFDTHIASIAQLLEVDPETIDLRDPKYRGIIETVDKDTGARRSMTTSEAEEYIRGTSEYDSTKGAMNKAASFAENLSRTFGKVAV